MPDDALPRAPPARTRSAALVIGVALIALSTLCWVAIPVLPFLPIRTAWKAAAVPVLLVLAELLFWPGAVLAGRAAVTRFLARFHPSRWRHRRHDGG